MTPVSLPVTNSSFESTGGWTQTSGIGGSPTASANARTGSQVWYFFNHEGTSEIARSDIIDVSAVAVNGVVTVSCYSFLNIAGAAGSFVETDNQTRVGVQFFAADGITSTGPITWGMLQNPGNVGGGQTWVPNTASAVKASGDTYIRIYIEGTNSSTTFHRTLFDDAAAEYLDPPSSAVATATTVANLVVSREGSVPSTATQVVLEVLDREGGVESTATQVVLEVLRSRTNLPRARQWRTQTRVLLEESDS